MSMKVLLQATRDFMKSQMGLTDFACDLRPGGRPPAIMGEQYISLDEGNTNSRPFQDFLEEEYAINVWVTRRTGIMPNDARQAIYEAQASGLNDVCGRVRAIVHRSYDLIDLGNLATAGGNKFLLPLFYNGTSEPLVTGADWAFSEHDEHGFIVKQLRFGGCKMVQYIGSIQAE